MTIDEMLKSALMMLDTCHVLGADAESFAAAQKNIRVCIALIKKAREEGESHEGDGEGQDV